MAKHPQPQNTLSIRPLGSVTKLSDGSLQVVYEIRTVFGQNAGAGKEIRLFTENGADDLLAKTAAERQAIEDRINADAAIADADKAAEIAKALNEGRFTDRNGELRLTITGKPEMEGQHAKYLVRVGGSALEATIDVDFTAPAVPPPAEPPAVDPPESVDPAKTTGETKIRTTIIDRGPTFGIFIQVLPGDAAYRLTAINTADGDVKNVSTDNHGEVTINGFRTGDVIEINITGTEINATVGQPPPAATKGFWANFLKASKGG